MAVTGVESGQWVVVDDVPGRVAASCLYDSADWLRRWERIGVERRVQHAYVCAGDDVLPLYETAFSPFWHRYESQCGLVGRFGSPIVFAGYGTFGSVAEPLVRGAYATAMAWIERGDAEVLVVPNLTSAGVDSWREFAGPPVGTVHLARSYSTDVLGSFGERLHWLGSETRRAEAGGLRVRVLAGAAAHALVPAALPLIEDFDEAALHGMLDIPGAMLVAAEADGSLVGVLFGVWRDDEVTFTCGGVDREHDVRTALRYRATRWAYENGVRRIEWGRDRFNERHGVRGTELWAMVYAPRARTELATVLNGMHATLHAYIEAA